MQLRMLLGCLAPRLSTVPTTKPAAANTPSDEVAKQRNFMPPSPFQKRGLAGPQQGRCLISLTCCRRATPIGQSNRQALKCDAGRIGNDETSPRIARAAGSVVGVRRQQMRSIFRSLTKNKPGGLPLIDFPLSPCLTPYTAI